MLNQKQLLWRRKVSSQVCRFMWRKHISGGQHRCVALVSALAKVLIWSGQKCNLALGQPSLRGNLLVPLPLQCVWAAGVWISVGFTLISFLVFWDSSECPLPTDCICLQLRCFTVVVQPKTHNWTVTKNQPKTTTALFWQPHGCASQTSYTVKAR